MGMFKPQIRISIDPSLKTYALEATVMVPNGCYLSGGTERGLPKDQYDVPETEPVILKIVKRDGLCTQGLKMLEYYLPGIPLVEGKDRLIAFATVGDDVVGVASKPVLQVEKLKSAMTAPQQLSGAQLNSVCAWVNAMPPGPPRIITVLNVFAPCLNHQFDVVDHGHFGVTGRTLLLKLSAKRPDICLDAIFDGPVKFEREIKKPDEFDSVAVEFEGKLTFDPLETVV